MADGDRAKRIRLLDPTDDDGFAPVFTARPVEAPPAAASRRRGRIVAPLALLAIVAAVAVISTSSDDPPANRAAPPTTAPPVVSPAPATAPPTAPTAVAASGSISPAVAITPSHAVRYAGVPPSGYSTLYASETSEVGYAGDDDGGQLVALWSSGIDAEAGGRWMRITASPLDAGSWLIGAVRLDTTIGPAFLSATSGGRFDLSGRAAGGSIQISSAGLSAAELTAVFAAVQRTPDDILVSPAAMPRGLRLAIGASAPSDQRWTGQTALYLADTTTGAYLVVESGPLPTPLQRASEWLLAIAPQVVDIGDDRGVLFHEPDQADATGITFDHRGAHVHVVATDLADDQLLAFARSLHAAGDGEWGGLQAEAAAHEAAANVDSGESTPVVGGTSLDGATWSIDVSRNSGRDRLSASFGTAGGSASFGTSVPVPADDAVPSITSSATEDVTLVTAALRSEAVPGATLRVHIGGATIDGSFVPVATTHLYVAAVPFEPDGPFTAEVVGADGTVQATYDPLANTASEARRPA